MSIKPVTDPSDPSTFIKEFQRKNPSAKANELLIRIFFHQQELLALNYQAASRWLSEFRGPVPDELEPLLENSKKFERVLLNPSSFRFSRIANMFRLWRALTADPATSEEMVGVRCLNHYGYQNISEPAKLARPKGISLKPFAYIHQQIPNSKPVGTVGYAFVTSKANIAKDASGRLAIGKRDLWTEDRVTRPDFLNPKKKVIVITHTDALVPSIHDLHQHYSTQLTTPLRYNESVVEALTYIDIQTLILNFDPSTEDALTTIFKVLYFRELFKIYGFSLPISQLSYQDEIANLVDRFDIEDLDFFKILTRKLKQEKLPIQTKIVAWLIAGTHGTTYYEGPTLKLRHLVNLTVRRKEFEMRLKEYIIENHPACYREGNRIAQEAIQKARKAKDERKEAKTATTVKGDEKEEKEIVKTHTGEAFSKGWTRGESSTIDPKLKKIKTMSPSEIRDRLRKTLGIDPKEINTIDKSGKTKLIEKLKEKNRHVVAILLKCGANPNLTPPNSESPLMIATRLCLPKEVALLIDAGANIHQENAIGETAFSIAGHAGTRGGVEREGFLQILHSLILATKEIDKADSRDRTLLTFAADNGNVKIVSLVIQRGGNPNWRGKGPSWINTPLNRAIFNDFYEIFTILMDAQADVFLMGMYLKGDEKVKVTPLSTAVSALNKGNDNAGKMLLMIVRKIIALGKVNHVDEMGMTPLLYFIGISDEKFAYSVLKKLLEAGADPNLCPPNREPPLMVAVRSCLPQVVDLLVENGADIHQENGEAKTAVSIAEQLIESAPDRSEDFGLILDCLSVPRAKINDYDSRDRTALTLAIDGNEVEAVRLIVRRGGNINWRGKGPEWINTPLIRAIYNDFFSVFEILMNAQADVFLMGMYLKGDEKVRVTPLSTAVEACNRGQPNAFKMLEMVVSRIVTLREANHVDEMEMSPLLYIMGIKDDNLAESLLEALLKGGADPNLKVAGKKSLLFTTSFHGKLALMDKLLFFGAKLDQEIEELIENWASRNPTHYQKIRFLPAYVFFKKKAFGDLTQYLIAKNPVLKVDDRLIQKFSTDQWGLIQISILLGNLNMLKEIVGEFPSLLDVADPKQRSLFYIAAGWGCSMPLLEWLYNEKPSFLIQKNGHGYNSVHAAISGNCLEALNWLYVHAKHLFEESVDGETALHIATKKHVQIEIAQFLCKHFPSMKAATNKEGKTPFETAVIAKNDEVAKLLGPSPEPALFTPREWDRILDEIRQLEDALGLQFVPNTGIPGSDEESGNPD